MAEAKVVAMSIESTFITVVMPVRNEERFIGDTLTQLLAQDYPRESFEILVVDGMSTDRTREIVAGIAREHAQVHLLDNPGRRSAAGRNVGFKNGKGDVFLVVDGHCFIPDTQLLRNVVACFQGSGADCLGRPQPLDPPGLTKFQSAVALARGSWLGHGGDSLIYGRFEGYASPVSNGAMYRKEVFSKVGYVDEAFDACEDLEHNYRVEQAGLRAYTSPKLTIRYYPRETLAALLRQMLRYGRGRFRFVRKHPSALTMNQLVPAGFVVGLLILVASWLIEAASIILLAVLSHGIHLPGVTADWLSVLGSVVMVSHWSVLFFSLVYACYALIVLAESFHLALQRGVGYLPVLPLVFLTIHWGLGCGFLVEAFSRNFPGGKDSGQGAFASF